MQEETTAGNIHRIVVTGGPCAGKTTGMNYLREKFSDLGLSVYVVREMATDIIMGGFDPSTATPSEILMFEEVLMGLQLDYERHAMSMAHILAARGSDTVVLFDRGVMDIQAYLSESEFAALLDERDLTPVQLRDKNYEAVIHMRTAAMGAEEFYTCENNKARLETVDQAIVADERTLEAWTGVPHLMVIDNSTDFEEKIRRTFAAACRVVGIPAPIEDERKFLISEVDWEAVKKIAVKIEIEQHYLSTENRHIEERVRRRGQDGSNVYFRTMKKKTGQSGRRIETEYQITGREFVESIRSDSDPTRVRVLKDRYCFVWENTYYELDVLREPVWHTGDILLEVELTEESDGDHIVIPPFITVERDVTDEEEYGNANLASKI